MQDADPGNFTRRHSATVMCALFEGVVTSVKISMQKRETQAHWEEVFSLCSWSPQYAPN